MKQFIWTNTNARSGPRTASGLLRSPLLSFLLLFSRCLCTLFNSALLSNHFLSSAHFLPALLSSPLLSSLLLYLFLLPASSAASLTSSCSWCSLRSHHSWAFVRDRGQCQGGPSLDRRLLSAAGQMKMWGRGSISVTSCLSSTSVYCTWPALGFRSAVGWVFMFKCECVYVQCDRCMCCRFCSINTCLSRVFKLWKNKGKKTIHSCKDETFYILKEH